MSAIAERWIGGCRRELPDRALVWNHSHLRRILRDYEMHHNQHRPQLPARRRAAETATRTDQSRSLPRPKTGSCWWPDQRISPGRMTWTRFSARTGPLAHADPWAALPSRPEGTTTETSPTIIWTVFVQPSRKLTDDPALPASRLAAASRGRARFLMRCPARGPPPSTNPAVTAAMEPSAFRPRSPHVLRRRSAWGSSFLACPRVVLASPRERRSAT